MRHSSTNAAERLHLQPHPTVEDIAWLVPRGDEYCGQKFLYKTKDGLMLTITVPPRRKDIGNPHDPSYYPMLSDTLALLGRIGTMYPVDSLILVALAHMYAAISLSIGTDVLRELAKKIMGNHDWPNINQIPHSRFTEEHV